MSDLSEFFSDKDKIKKLEAELLLLKAKYEKILSTALTVRADKAIKLIKLNKFSHAEIAEKASLSVYHINRLSSELKKGIRD